MFPFKQFEENDKLIRVFEENIDASELIWHQDREDRTIKVIPLKKGQELFIPKMTYHRVIKGTGPLVVEVRMHEGSM
jgi:hypothetical protein